MNEQLHPTQYQQQTELLEQLMAPQPVVIGLEGGPCSGKTTLTNQIGRQALSIDRPFMAIPEAATIHIERLMAEGKTVPDLAACDRPAYLALQTDIIRSISTAITEAKQTFRGTDAIILVDRPDIGAYVTGTEYEQVLERAGLRRPPIQTHVDKLVYLPSVASEQPERYMELRGNNGARYETSTEEAAAVDAANLRAVRTHPELEVAWGGDFAEKIRHLAAFVLQPELEGEIKQAVPPAQAEEWVAQAAATGNLLNTMRIEQSYHALNGQEFRLRRSMGDDASLHHYLTIKTGEGAFRRELQRAITADEYTLLRGSEQIGRQLVKDRHVVLDQPDESGKRRLWFADKYLQPELADWHFETTVADEAEVDELDMLYRATRRRVTESAKTLIFV